MGLEIASGGFDVFPPAIDDPAGAGCPSTCGQITDLTFGKASPGSYLVFPWTDNPQMDEDLIFESSTPNGSFDMPNWTAHSGARQASIPMAPSVRSLQVDGRTHAGSRCLGASARSPIDLDLQHRASSYPISTARNVYVRSAPGGAAEADGAAYSR